MRYLVTGGAGFIGSHLVRRLLSQKHEVEVIDDFSNGSSENLSGVSPLITFQEDISTAHIRSGYDGIFHLATHPRYYSIEDPYTNIRTNMLGMANVLDYAKENGCKVITASNSGIGRGTLPINEGSEDYPTTPYDVTKLSSEHLCKVYHDLHGVESLVLRFGTVYGTRQKVSDELKWYPVIPTFIRDSRQGSIWITGDGRQTRDFVYVDDVVDALIYAMKSPHGDARKYLISSGTEFSLLDIHSLLQNMRGEEIPIKWKEPLMGDIPRSWLDCTKAQEELGWTAKTPLRKGLEILLEDS